MCNAYDFTFKSYVAYYLNFKSYVLHMILNLNHIAAASAETEDSSAVSLDSGR